MYSFSAITDVEMHHNPNEGRVIINENFRKMISGVTESISSISGGTGSTSSTLSEVLIQGNQTGANNIIISSGQTISSSSGGGQLDLNKGGIGYVSLNTDDGGESEVGLSMNPTTINIFSNGYNKGFYLTDTETEWWNQDTDENNQKTIITIGSQRVFWGHNNSNFDRTWNQGIFPAALALNASSPTFLSGVSNSIILGGVSITATTDSTAYVSNLNINSTPETGSISDKLLVRSSDGSIKAIDQPQYVEYRANLTQSGVNSPSATTLGSLTLTGGSWSYSSIGSYLFTKTGAFSATSNVEIEIDNTQVYAYTMSNAGFALISAAVYSDDSIEVRTSYWGVYPNVASGGTNQNVVTPGTNGLSVSDAMSNDILNNTRFCVRVWS